MSDMTAQAAETSQVNKDLRIGYLDDDDFSDLFTQILDGIVEAARSLSVNIIRFGYTTHKEKAEEHYKKLYSLIKEANLDGLIFLAWTHAGPMYFRDSFLEAFAGMPLIAVGNQPEGIPSVLSNGNSSIREITLHLIQTHQYEKIAYMPPERPDDRIASWREALVENGLYLEELEIRDEEWKVSGSVARAKRFLEILLDERGISIDAIVSSGHHETEILMEELSKRQLRVPLDIALTSYDDGEYERYSTPGITTVYYPWTEMGSNACRLLVNWLQTGNVPIETAISTRVMYRESCGCKSDFVASATSGPVLRPEKGRFTEELRGRIISVLEEAYPYPSFDFEIMLDSFIIDVTMAKQKNKLSNSNVNSESSLFLETLVGQFERASDSVKRARLEALVLKFRKAVMPWLASDVKALLAAGELFRSAQSFLLNGIAQARGHAAILEKNRAQAMQEVSQGIMTAKTIRELTDTIMVNFPKLGIDFCGLALFPDYGTNPLFAGAKMLLLSESILLDIKKQEMETLNGQTPNDFFNCLYSSYNRKHLLQVHPLEYLGTWLGYAVFEPGPEDEQTYRALARHLESALKNVSKAEKIRKNSQQILDRAYEDGMADVVSLVICHTGNVFNSVNASVQVLIDSLKKIPIEDLLRAEELLEEYLENKHAINDSHIKLSYESDSAYFNPERLSRLSKLFLLLGRRAEQGNKNILAHIERILEKIRWMDDSIIVQQSYEEKAEDLEVVYLSDVLEDALRVHSRALTRGKVSIVRPAQRYSRVEVSRGKLLLVLIFLLEKMISAIEDSMVSGKSLRISISNSNNCCSLRLSGKGADIRKVFTRKSHSIENKPSINGNQTAVDQRTTGSEWKAQHTLYEAETHGVEACLFNVAEMGGKVTIEYSIETGETVILLKLPGDPRPM